METRMMKDDFEFTTKSWVDFKEVVNDYLESGSWEKTPMQEITLITTEQVTGNISSIEDLELFNDTASHANMFIRVGEKEYPIGETALLTLSARYGVGGPTFKKMKKEDFCNFMNMCKPYLEKQYALLRVAGKKVRGMMATKEHGDVYNVIPMDQIFDEADMFMNDTFTSAEFKGGSMDHYMTIGKWEIIDDRLDDAYHLNVDINDDVRALVTVKTSDVGFCGANIDCALVVNGMTMEGISDTALNSMSLVHQYGHSIDDFKENLNGILTRCEETIDKFAELKEIPIKHHANCLQLLMEHAGIPASIISEVLDIHLSIYPLDEPITALDVYADICSALDYTDAEGRKLDLLREKIASVLRKDFKAYDLNDSVAKKKIKTKGGAKRVA